MTVAKHFERLAEWSSSAGKLIAILVFVVILAMPSPEGLPPAAHRLLAVTAFMVVLWFSQAIPLAATSLVPLVAFPLLGIQSARDVSESYIDANVFLFLAGFIIALGIEKWGLHRRIALHIVRVLGTSPRRVVLGFMLATGFLSMWISNTASTLLMLPIAMAMVGSLTEVLDEQRASQDSPARRSVERLSVVLLLGIAYSASVGGMTTLVGTVTNVAFLQIWRAQFPRAEELAAGEWMLSFVPVGFVLLIASWVVLTWRLPAASGVTVLDRNYFTDRLKALGKPRWAELQMLAIFAATALLWVFRKPIRIGGGDPLLPGWGVWAERLLLNLGVEPELAAGAIHDSTVAVGMALLMFFLPARRGKDGHLQPLMDWQTASKLPWDILLLIGGGFALAGAFSATGLSEWMGTGFARTVGGWPPWLLVAGACLLMTFLTEFTSNVATVSALIPILAGAAVSLQVDPRLLMIPAAIATSCAFMLPIATPPNAIVFSSGKIRMGQMARYGIVLNLVGTVLITLATFLVLVPQLGISLETMPDWALDEPGAR